MTKDEFTVWALTKAREIVSREGAELALRSRELDVEGVEADATLLGAAIAKALIEAFEMGAKG